MKKNKIFVFDMDGVLVEYRRDMSPENISLMKEKGYFANLRPEWNVILALKELVKEYPCFILTAIFPTEFPYSVQEKKEYCQKVFPFMEDNLIIVNSEEGETKAEKFTAVTGYEIDKTVVLIDDYGKNLKAWSEAGGTSVKNLNLINNNHGTVYEHYINCFMSPEEIIGKLKNI